MLRSNSDYYLDKSCIVKSGTSKYFVPAFESGNGYITIKGGEKINYYVKKQDCICGVTGNGIEIGNWVTANSTTVLLVTDDSLIVTHNRKDSNSQTQIVHTVSNVRDLAGKLVTFSVEARVISENETTCGSIAIINADNYNKGNLFAKTDFGNRNWEKIILTKKLPNGDDFKGLTLCLRAIQEAQKGYSVVEFKNPRLEIGMLSLA